jgi:nitrogen fixation protein FixH
MFQSMRQPFDRWTGGRGHYVLFVLAFVLLLFTLYGIAVFVMYVLALAFPRTFGGQVVDSVAAASAAAGNAAAAAGVVEPQVVLDEDEFFQNDDL